MSQANEDPLCLILMLYSNFQIKHAYVTLRKLQFHYLFQCSCLFLPIPWGNTLEGDIMLSQHNHHKFNRIHLKLNYYFEIESQKSYINILLVKVALSSIFLNISHSLSLKFPWRGTPVRERLPSCPTLDSLPSGRESSHLSNRPVIEKELSMFR